MSQPKLVRVIRSAAVSYRYYQVCTYTDADPICYAHIGAGDRYRL